MPSPHHVGAVPVTDTERLREFLLSTVATSSSKRDSLDFGAYNEMSRAQAVRGVELVKNEKFITGLLRVIPSGRCKPLVLQHAILKVLQKIPQANRLSSDRDMARATSSTILIMLAHIRRLRNDKLKRQAMCECDAEQSEALARLAQCCGDGNDTDDGLDTFSTTSRTSSSSSTVQQTPQKKQKQDPADKPMKLDKSGYPNLSDSDDELKAAAEQEASIPWSGRTVGWVEASTDSKAVKARKSVRKTNNKNKTAQIGIGLIKLECYTSKSYVRVKDEQGKWRLLVQLEAKQASNHQEVMTRCFEDAQAFDQDKSAMVKTEAGW